MEATKAVVHHVPPYLTVYSDGTIDRFIGTETTPPGLDPQTGVTSKEILIQPQTNLSARLYRPTNHHHHRNRKLPLLIYFHGGAFLISSSADPKYHQMLNLLVQTAQIIVVSVNYRLAPENPLPAAYDDSWTALQWVDYHNSVSLGSLPSRCGTTGLQQSQGNESWLTEFVDFDRVFLAGDSAGANISHHMAIKAATEQSLRLKVYGILMVQPYFWGEEAIGVERENPVFKGVVDQWWRFVCPSDRGCDDPLINPFGDGDWVVRLGCEKVLVCVAGNDVLRERGRLYYETLVKNKFGGKVELFVTEGEDHVFHIIDPTSENATKLIKHCAQFINHHY